MLASWVGQTDGAAAMDFWGAMEITSMTETSASIQSERKRGLPVAARGKDFLSPLPSGSPNDVWLFMVFGLVNDSAIAIATAKPTRSTLPPSLVIMSCFAHLLSILTGFMVCELYSNEFRCGVIRYR